MSKDQLTSLHGAFNIAVKSIKDNYDKDWVTIGDPGEDGLKLIPWEDKKMEYYKIIDEPHHHSFTEICICLRGTGAMQYQDSLFEVKAGDVFLIMPSVVHRELWKKNSDYVALWIAFDLNRAVPHIFVYNNEEGFYIVDGSSLKHEYDFNQLLYWIQDEIKNKSIYYKEMIKSYLFKIIINTLRKHNEIKDSKGSSNELWKESVVMEVQTYIENHYTKNPRLAEISLEVCISINYLNTIFKSITGKTIMQYMEDFKIEKAKQLIIDTVDSIHSISSMLGYYDQYHFSKIFKKQTGVTPTQYRKACGIIH